MNKIGLRQIRQKERKKPPMAFNVVKKKEMAGGLCRSVEFYSSGSNVKSFCVLLRASGQFSLFLPRATHSSWHGKYVVRFLV